MIIISGIRTGLDQPKQTPLELALLRLPVSADQVKRAFFVKTSLDARRRNKIALVHSVCVELYKGESEIVDKISDSSVVYREAKPVLFEKGSLKPDGPIIVAGFGPAGMFAALYLARHGYRPVVLERGPELDRRVEAVDRFWKQGILDPNANVQFGEGGAGTFSDGKLTTRISDPHCSLVLQDFIKHGAPEEISYKAKPHIGTDKLRGIVKSIRKEIISLGGQVEFCCSLEQICLDGSKLNKIKASGGYLSASALILAVGHSARDTFSMLHKKGLNLQAKPFSVGARIEHLQAEIERGLYGEHAGHPMLPKGEYQLSYRKGRRGVYTFCMCPGGLVVPSSSSSNSVVTNGMSEYARNRLNANSALVVGVGPEDFGKMPLDGIAFQQRLEELSFRLAGSSYWAPAVTVGNFLVGKSGLSLNRVEPSYSLGVEAVDFDKLFPPSITQMMRLGLKQFGRQIKGFDCLDAVLTAPETRTSSPVRILRDESFCSEGIQGIYPCGEGAGYAGGIMSAAVDGIKVAKAVMKRFKPY